MMGQMSEMMAGCNRMMRSNSNGGSEGPGEQWREKSPATAFQIRTVEDAIGNAWAEAIEED
jgi:hypothetical protein